MLLRTIVLLITTKYYYSITGTAAVDWCERCAEGVGGRDPGNAWVDVIHTRMAGPYGSVEPPAALAAAAAGTRKPRRVHLAAIALTVLGCLSALALLQEHTVSAPAAYVSKAAKLSAAQEELYRVMDAAGVKAARKAFARAKKTHAAVDLASDQKSAVNQELADEVAYMDAHLRTTQKASVQPTGGKPDASIAAEADELSIAAASIEDASMKQDPTAEKLAAEWGKAHGWSEKNVLEEMDAELAFIVEAAPDTTKIQVVGMSHTAKFNDDVSAEQVLEPTASADSEKQDGARERAEIRAWLAQMPAGSAEYSAWVDLKARALARIRHDRPTDSLPVSAPASNKQAVFPNGMPFGSEQQFPTVAPTEHIYAAKTMPRLSGTALEFARSSVKENIKAKVAEYQTMKLTPDGPRIKAELKGLKDELQGLAASTIAAGLQPKPANLDFSQPPPASEVPPATGQDERDQTQPPTADAEPSMPAAVESTEPEESQAQPDTPPQAAAPPAQISPGMTAEIQQAQIKIGRALEAGNMVRAENLQKALAGLQREAGMLVPAQASLTMPVVTSFEEPMVTSFEEPATPPSAEHWQPQQASFVASVHPIEAAAMQPTVTTFEEPLTPPSAEHWQPHQDFPAAAVVETAAVVENPVAPIEQLVPADADTEKLGNAGAYDEMLREAQSKIGTAEAAGDTGRAAALRLALSALREAAGATGAYEASKTSTSESTAMPPSEGHMPQQHAAAAVGRARDNRPSHIEMARQALKVQIKSKVAEYDSSEGDAAEKQGLAAEMQALKVKLHDTKTASMEVLVAEGGVLPTAAPVVEQAPASEAPAATPPSQEEPSSQEEAPAQEEADQENEADEEDNSEESAAEDADESAVDSTEAPTEAATEAPTEQSMPVAAPQVPLVGNELKSARAAMQKRVDAKVAEYQTVKGGDEADGPRVAAELNQLKGELQALHTPGTPTTAAPAQQTATSSPSSVDTEAAVPVETEVTTTVDESGDLAQDIAEAKVKIEKAEAAGEVKRAASLRKALVDLQEYSPTEGEGVSASSEDASATSMRTVPDYTSSSAPPQEHSADPFQTDEEVADLAAADAAADAGQETTLEKVAPTTEEDESTQNGEEGESDGEEGESDGGEEEEEDTTEDADTTPAPDTSAQKEAVAAAVSAFPLDEETGTAKPEVKYESAALQAAHDRYAALRQQVYEARLVAANIHKETAAMTAPDSEDEESSADETHDSEEAESSVDADTVSTTQVPAVEETASTAQAPAAKAPNAKQSHEDKMAKEREEVREVSRQVQELQKQVRDKLKERAAKAGVAPGGDAAKVKVGSVEWIKAHPSWKPPPTARVSPTEDKQAVQPAADFPATAEEEENQLQDESDDDESSTLDQGQQGEEQQAATARFAGLTAEEMQSALSMGGKENNFQSPDTAKSGLKLKGTFEVLTSDGKGKKAFPLTLGVVPNDAEGRANYFAKLGQKNNVAIGIVDMAEVMSL